VNPLSFLLAPMLLIAPVQSNTADPLATLHLSAAVPSGWRVEQEPDQKRNIVMFVNDKIVGDSLLFQTTDAQNETLAQAVTDAKTTIGIPDYTVSKSYRVCNGTQDGWYLESPPVTGIVARSIVAVSATRWTVVTYMHLPQFGDPDPAALHALDSVCLQ
jgi:hypothetical protein